MCPLFGVQIMAGAEGFEPPITGPEPVALPLGHAPTKTKSSMPNGGRKRNRAPLTRNCLVLNNIHDLTKTIFFAIALVLNDIIAIVRKLHLF